MAGDGLDVGEGGGHDEGGEGEGFGGEVADEFVDEVDVVGFGEVAGG